ncbi:universal stress protein [uncultured Meiothermus sp.]|jgi:nucleotide-binding universal stress UspA family protein|uniref:universal stress protein n=1 Tax=uncultured Meiothermus sp. TaxID=157471 RepID=UPI0026281A13|nr:universal stress protein [uncultured Meiothermus sp.]
MYKRTLLPLDSSSVSEVAARPGLAAGLQAWGVVEEGHETALAICQTSLGEGCAPSAMGTHGRGGLRRLSLSSVAHEGVAQARQPVLRVPARCTAG